MTHDIKCDQRREQHSYLYLVLKAAVSICSLVPGLCRGFYLLSLTSEFRSGVCSVLFKLTHSHICLKSVVE